jgi:hypothetical protein
MLLRRDGANERARGCILLQDDGTFVLFKGMGTSGNAPRVPDIVLLWERPSFFRQSTGDQYAGGLLDRDADTLALRGSTHTGSCEYPVEDTLDLAPTKHSDSLLDLARIRQGKDTADVSCTCLELTYSFAARRSFDLHSGF